MDIQAPKSPGERVRAFRLEQKWSLDHMADLISREGIDRPSAAKLSRIETGVQPITLDVLPPISKLTGIPRDELRPDLAMALRETAQ